MRHDFKLTSHRPAYPLAAGASDVGQDMERIFGAAAQRAKAAAPDPVLAIATAEPGKRRSWIPAIIVAALAGLVIAGAAVWMALQAGVATPAASRAAAPVKTAAPVNVVAPVAVAAAPAPAPAMRPPVASAPRPPLVVARAAAPRPAAAAPHHRPKATQRARPTDGDGLDDRFNARIRADPMYPDIAAADQEMREAYDRAAYVGLDPRVLRTYRERWRQVRRAVEPDPDYAIEAYYQLARELDAARRRS